MFFTFKFLVANVQMIILEYGFISRAVDDLKILKEKANSTDDSGELESIKKSIKEIEDMAKEAKKKKEEADKEERLRPWNVDTISKEGFSKSTINKKIPRSNEHLSEEERESKKPPPTSLYFLNPLIIKQTLIPSK